MVVEQLLDCLELRFDILAFTETWLTNDSHIPEFNGYYHTEIFRTGKKGGGVSLYYKSYLACSVISEYTRVSANYECLLVGCRDYIIGVVYRPPSGSPSIFLDFLQEIFQYASESKLPMILVGDFNINLMLSDSWQLEFLDLVQSHGYENVIDCPTRVTSETETLIDLCLTNAMRNDVVSGVLTVDLSDHLPLFCFLPCANVGYNKTNITNPYYRDINDYSIERFVTLVSAIHWNDKYNEPDPSFRVKPSL
ncbi:uncharacterized protein LOC120840490 [Ixodes scapularis]|uniref:uncharacterized protein LOC120840490 n=1 Tax=Ixodes scapularis TaxID=6945 RepID=UPI001A9D8334|nr:uncharacterized protein LOC120840490 [Ixodes scapularis]